MDSSEEKPPETDACSESVEDNESNETETEQSTPAGAEMITSYPPPAPAVPADAPEGSHQANTELDDAEISLKRKLGAFPEDMTLDEISELKKRLKIPAFEAHINHPSGKVDLRGRPIPGLAEMPEDKRVAGDDTEGGSRS